MDALQRIKLAEQSFSDGLEALNREVQSQVSKKLSLEKEIEAVGQTLTELHTSFEQEKADLEGKIAEKRQKHNKLTDLIADVAGQLETAEAKLKATKKQHKEFMEYRTRANAELEARESAILEKEEKLDTILSTAKRRTSILANVK